MLREIIARLLKKEQQGIRLVSNNPVPEYSSILPKGFMLEAEEIWLEQECLEKEIILDGTKYSAIANDFRTVLPIHDYRSVNPYRRDDWPSNHFEIGLFGCLGYVVENKENGLLKVAALPSVRLAHVHYPTSERPIFVDIGIYYYNQLSAKIGLDIVPKGCYPLDLFGSMKPEIQTVAERYLNK